jgi:hypothetical protein
MTESTEQLTLAETQEWLFLNISSWRSWAGNATTLRDAAHILWTYYQKEYDRMRRLGDEALGQSFDLRQEEVAMMLMGMSLENLLKGCLIIRDPSLVSKKKIPNKLKTHDLGRLMAFVGIAPKDRQEQQYVETLSDFVEWQGRYPGPLDADKIRGVFRVGGSWQSFNDLFERVLVTITPEQTKQDDEALSLRLDQFWQNVEKSHHPAQNSQANSHSVAS